MTTQQRELFSGEDDSKEQPGDFLRRFRSDMRAQSITTDADKISAFEDALRTGSIADEWFEKLGIPEKTTWKALEKAFKERFPGVEKATKSNTELERELQGMRLRVEDLGKTEVVQGTDVYTHIAFANRALQLAKRAGIDKGSNSVWQVCNHLPDIIKEKVGESHTSWLAFCNEIKAVDLVHIRDGVAKHEKQAKKEREFANRLATLENTRAIIPNSPTATIRTQMAQTSITNTRGNTGTTPNPQANNGNPFGPRGGQGNLFTATTGRRQARPAPTQAQRDALRERISILPHHPNTTAGKTAHMAQLEAWGTQYGRDTRVTEATPFPLTPGTSNVCSGECYACGQVDTGHNGNTCPNKSLPAKERTWRAICGTMLGTINRQRVVHVNVVQSEGDGEEVPWYNRVGTDTYGGQGNGEGPSE
jgi:hypothetical protein